LIIFLCRLRRFDPVFTLAILYSPAVPWAPVAHSWKEGHLLLHPAAAILIFQPVQHFQLRSDTQLEGGLGWMITTLQANEKYK
jgi:hypothetical protein